MKNTKNILWAFPIFCILFFTSCEKSDPTIPNEEELITTLIYTLTPEIGGEAVEFRFQDLDGNGGNEPIITHGVLAPHTVYTGKLKLLNETVEPAEDISEEVAEEAEEHQFFFSFTGVDATIVYADIDANGNPLGLENSLETGEASSGTLTITLRHGPDKAASGVATGAMANAGGETDIEVTFGVTIQ